MKITIFNLNYAFELFPPSKFTRQITTVWCFSWVSLLVSAYKGFSVLDSCKNRGIESTLIAFQLLIYYNFGKYVNKRMKMSFLPEPIRSGSSSPVSILAKIVFEHFKKASSTLSPVLALVSRNIKSFSCANLERERNQSSFLVLTK